MLTLIGLRRKSDDFEALETLLGELYEKALAFLAQIQTIPALFCREIHAGSPNAKTDFAPTFYPSTFPPLHSPHSAVFAQRDRSLVGETGPRELSLQSGDFSCSGTGPHLRDRSLGDRSFLRDRFPNGEPSGLSQILAFSAGVAHGDRSPQPGIGRIDLPRDH
uniref:Uncharacterized protein n=1 Tax=Ananas comosus var. bracteatus TaxID=296719 RepID=A0A6V7NPW5_ANACO|nr:unnamed protein product [Ananas comosus var. bracteatus]